MPSTVIAQSYNGAAVMSGKHNYSMFKQKLQPCTRMPRTYIAMPVSYTHLDVYKRQMYGSSYKRP